MATMEDVRKLLATLTDPRENEPVLAINQLAAMRAVQGGYPVDMYHPTLDAIQALNRAQEKALTEQGYGRQYIPKQYPRMLYRRNMHPRFAALLDDATKRPVTVDYVESRTVLSRDEEDAIKGDRIPEGCGPWSRTLGEIEPLPADPIEAPSVKIARLEGELAALRNNQHAAKKKD